MIAIQVKNLTKRFRDIEALKNINLTIEQGEFYCLMGPNGSGKTTLSAIIASVRSQTSGIVEIYGKESIKSKDIIGYMPQQNFSSASLTGRENLLYFARLNGYSKKEASNITNDLFKKLGLENDADRLVSKYSGGMRKRLELATILFPNIKVLILDEPTTGLDPAARRNFFSLIEDIKTSQITIILITHIGSDAEFATRVGLIDKGVIIAEGSPEELKKNNNIKNTINIEVSAKNEEVKEILVRFNEFEQVLEMEEGYRIFSNDVAVAIPSIIRAIDKEGNKVLRIESTSPSIEDVFFKLTGRAVKEISG